MLLKDEDDTFGKILQFRLILSTKHFFGLQILLFHFFLVQELVSKAELPFIIRFRNAEIDFLPGVGAGLGALSDEDDELAYLAADINGPLAYFSEDTIGGADPDEDELAYLGETNFGGAVVEKENEELWEDEWV